MLKWHRTRVRQGERQFGIDQHFAFILENTFCRLYLHGKDDIAQGHTSRGFVLDYFWIHKKSQMFVGNLKWFNKTAGLSSSYRHTDKVIQSHRFPDGAREVC